MQKSQPAPAEIENLLAKLENYCQYSDELSTYVDNLRAKIRGYDPLAERLINRHTRGHPELKIYDYDSLESDHFIMSFNNSKSAFLIKDRADILRIYDSIAESNYRLFQIILARYPQYPVIRHNCNEEQLAQLITYIRQYYRSPGLKIETSNKEIFVIDKVYQNRSDFDLEFLKIREFIQLRSEEIANLISLPNMEQKDNVMFFRQHLQPAVPGGYIEPINIVINNTTTNMNVTVNGDKNTINIQNEFVPPKLDETVTSYYNKYGQDRSKNEFEQEMHAKGYRKFRMRKGTVWKKVKN